jgi:hypothetical protein
VGGKEIMIKVVGQSIPVYIMSIFKLQDGVCEQMEQTIRNFWWGTKNGKRKVHWTAWWKLTRAKNRGGLGFRDLKLFNQSILARQAWRLLKYPDSLCVGVLKVKYYPNGDLIDTTFTSVISPTWRAITQVLDLLKKGLIWRVGNGDKIHIWRHNWIPRQTGLQVTGKRRPSRRKRVGQLLNESRTQWDWNHLDHFFLPRDRELILKIKVHGPDRGDLFA